MKQHVLLALILFSTSSIEKPQAIIPPCNDDPTFSFGGYEWNGTITTRTCEWITANPQRTQVRRDNWCNVGNVSEKCPEACDTCSPQVAGIMPPCYDVSDFSFGGYEWNGAYETRTCEWITANPQRTEVRRDNWCGNDAVSENCPEACNKCPPPPPDMCDNKSPPYSFGINEWHDNGGVTFNCEWYNRTNNACKLFGDKFENFNMTANDACCTCGGGWLILA